MVLYGFCMDVSSVSMLFQWNHHVQLEHFCKASYLSLAKALLLLQKSWGALQGGRFHFETSTCLNIAKGRYTKVYEATHVVKFPFSLTVQP